MEDEKTLEITGAILMALVAIALYVEYYRFWMFDFLLLISANMYLSILLIAVGRTLYNGERRIADLTILVVMVVCFNILLNSVYTAKYTVFYIPASYLYVAATSVSLVIMSIREKLFIIEVIAITCFTVFMNIINAPMTILLQIASTGIVALLTYAAATYLMAETEG